MRTRVAVLFAAILLYSGAVIGLNAVVLPATGLNGVLQLQPSSFDFLGPAQPAGQPEANEPERHDHSWGAGRWFNLWLRPFGVHRPDVNDVWWGLGSFAVLATLSTALLFIFPKRVRYGSQLLRAEPAGNHLLNVLLGVLAYFVAYALLRLSWLTIVGVPFIPFLMGGMWLATMLGIVCVSFTLGRVLLRATGVYLPPLAEALTGLWLLFVTSMLPVLGWLAGGGAAALGFGVLLQTRFGSRERWSLSVLEEPAATTPPLPADSKVVPLRRAR